MLLVVPEDASVDTTKSVEVKASEMPGAGLFVVSVRVPTTSTSLAPVLGVARQPSPRNPEANVPVALICTTTLLPAEALLQ